MELELIRTYYPNGTNGEIFLNGKRLCFSIELPWNNNHSQTSSIPESKYELKIRYSKKFRWHLRLDKVQDRELILMHPANNALKELKGCIAPVSFLTGEGTGTNSLIALTRIIHTVFPELDALKPVFLIIKSDKK